MNQSEIKKALAMIAEEQDGASYLAKKYGIRVLQDQLERTRRTAVKELLSDAIQLRRWR